MSSGTECVGAGFLSDWFQVILPSIVIIVGWVVASSLQSKATAKHQTRKDCRSRIRQLDKDLQELRDNSIEYYTDASKGADLATQMRAGVEDIRRQVHIINLYFEQKLDEAVLLDCLGDIMDAATGGAFETKNRVTIQACDPQLATLFHGTAKLIWLFEEKFLAIHSPLK